MAVWKITFVSEHLDLFFFHWNILVIYLTVVLKLAAKVNLLAYIFKHSDWNGLIIFSRFKNVSVYDKKITENKQI